MIAEGQRRFDGDQQAVAGDVLRVVIRQERRATALPDDVEPIQRPLDFGAAAADDVGIERHTANASRVVRRRSDAMS